MLSIKKWTIAGVSLERIRELLHGEAPPVAPRPRGTGTVEVRTHLTVADGIEVVIEPGRAKLSPEEVRALIKGVVAAIAAVTDEQPADSGSIPKQERK